MQGKISILIFIQLMYYNLIKYGKHYSIINLGRYFIILSYFTYLYNFFNNFKNTLYYLIHVI